LGLTLTKNIVELHRGQIGVDSEPGAGSTFWIIMPLRIT
jgi:signal transduction histidine kinase